jgi:hypothetical protein
MTTTDTLEPLTVIHPEGTLLRAPNGVEFVSGDFISDEEAEDGPAFYYGHNNGGYNNVDFPARGLVVVKSREELAARTLPTRAELASALAGALSSIDAGGLDLEGADVDADTGEVEFFGATADGLTFAFTVSIGSITDTRL